MGPYDGNKDGIKLNATRWSSTGLEVLLTADFPAGRLDRPGTYVVCFAAEWCPVTRRFMSRYVPLKAVLSVQVAIADITNRDDPLWDVFQVRITPSIIVFRDGTLVQRFDGRRFLGVTNGDLTTLREAFSSR
jgi:hypothetical protein